MDEMNFSDMCVEAARLTGQELGLNIPLAKIPEDIGSNEWGLKIFWGGAHPKSAHIVCADSEGELYTSGGLEPKLGYRTYSDGDARAYARAFIDLIADVKQRVANKQTDKMLTRT